HDDRVAYQISNDGHQATKERCSYNNKTIVQLDRQDEDRCQYGIDGGNHDLRSHHSRKALVKCGKPSSDRLAANRIQIVAVRGSVTLRFKTGIGEKANCNDYSNQTEHDFRSRSPRKPGKTPDVMDLAFNSLQQQLL